MINKVLILIGSMLFCTQLLAADISATKAKIEQYLQGSIRDEAEKARDANRKPAEVLEFFGLRDDMKVLEISPSGGYWTKFLGPTMRDNGELIIAIRITDELKNNILALDGFDRVTAINEDLLLPSLPAFSSDTSDLDMALTFWNLHNPSAQGRAYLNQAVFDALKSGGIYGVVDHTRRHGQPTNRAVARRLDPVLVIKELVDIGFEFVAFSDMHYHPEDDLYQEVGTQGIQGNTDRFTIKFRKP